MKRWHTLQRERDQLAAERDALLVSAFKSAGLIQCAGASALTQSHASSA